MSWHPAPVLSSCACLVILRLSCHPERSEGSVPGQRTLGCAQDDNAGLRSLRLRLDLGGCQDRLDDLVVASTAAEVAHHPLLDLLLGRTGHLVQQRAGGHDLAGRADAALKAAVLDEGALDRVQLVALREA